MNLLIFKILIIIILFKVILITEISLKYKNSKDLIFRLIKIKS
jgi:hypothetical protein